MTGDETTLSDHEASGGRSERVSPVGGLESVSPEEARTAALIHLRAHHRTTEAALESRLDLLRVARFFGASWEEMGEAMGMTRQAAHKRFSQQLRDGDTQQGGGAIEDPSPL